MESSGAQTVTVSEVLEEMKTLSEKRSKRADSPAEEEPNLQLPTGLKVNVVTEPVDGDMLKKKRKAAVFIILAAVTNLAMVAAFFNVMRIVIVRGTRNDPTTLSVAFSQEFEEEVVVTYTTIFGLFGIVSGVLITLFNYRVVAAAGAVLSGLGCLIASFLDLQNQTAMAFVYGFLPGVGNNFLFTAAVVAVLECFTEKRLLTLLLTTFVYVFVQLILSLILILDQSANSTSWQVILRIMFGAYCVCVLASWGLVPLNLHMKGNSRDSVRARITNTAGYQQVLRSPLLYLMAGVFFFTGLGERIPVDMSEHWWILAPLILLLAALLTTLITCCCSCRKTSRKTSLLVTAVSGFMMGGLSLAVKGLDEFPYAVVFSSLYGIGYGLRIPVMQNLIPLVMGDKYLPLTVGCLTFAKGVGSIIGEKSSAAITKDFSRYDAPFYLSGLALITSAVMVVVVIWLVNRVGPESQSDEEGGTAQINQLPPTTAAKSNLSAPPEASQSNLVTSLRCSGPRSDDTAKDAGKPASMTQGEGKED